MSAAFENGQVLRLGEGETLFYAGDPVHSMYLVTEGRVDLIRHSASGARMTLTRAGAGQVLAEASAYSTAYHCDGIAVTVTSLTAIPTADFRDRLAGDAALALAWAANLARALQAARMNAEIRTLRTVAERLDAWLDGERHLPPKGQWQDLAHTLGVSREALYRELAKRRA